MNSGVSDLHQPFKAIIMDCNSKSEDQYEIITVKAGDGACPLVFAHGVTGHANYTQAFARATSPKQTILEIKWKEPANEAKCRTMEEYSATLVPEVCRKIPDGPFVLIGHSFGGQLAYELAQQLLSQGREPALLILLDSKPDHERRAFGIRLNTPISAIQPMCSHFYRGYVPKPYPGNVHLFQSEIPYDTKYADSTYGWGALCINGLKITAIPGDHFDIVSIMFVGRWSSLLETSVQESLAAWRDGHIDSKQNRLQQLQRESPNEESTYLLIEAATFCKEGRLSDEIATYEKYIHQFPEQGPYYAYRNLGEAYWQNGQYNQAIEAFRNGIFFEDNPIMGWVHLGKYLIKLGRKEEAEECFAKAITFCPNETTPKVSLGNFAQELRRWSEAEEWYRDALELRPSNRYAMIGLAQVLSKQGRLEEAFQFYDKLCKVSLPAESHFVKRYFIADFIGMTDSKQKFLDEAINRYSKSIIYKPFQFRNRLFLACLYKIKGLDTKALNTVKEALAIFPKANDRAKFIAKFNKFGPQRVMQLIDRPINVIKHLRHIDLFCYFILKGASRMLLASACPQK